MHQTFEEHLDPTRREATEGIYRAAQRVETLLGQPVGEFMYISGAFGNIYSASGKAAGGNEERRRAAQENVVSFAAKSIAKIEHMLADVAAVVPPDSLRDVSGIVQPLKGGHKAGVDVNDYPCARQYVDELNALDQRVNTVLEPLRAVTGLTGVILKDDLAAIAGLYRTLQLDLKVWQATAVEASSNDPRRYNADTLETYRRMAHDPEGVAGIVDQHEKAFSQDGLSARDRSVYWMLGVAEFDSLDAQMDERPFNMEVSPTFADPKGYLAALGLTADQFVGQKEKDIQPMVKKAYYARALSSHPDRHPNDLTAEARFKTISEAYEILSKREKREKYLAS